MIVSDRRSVRDVAHYANPEVVLRIKDKLSCSQGEAEHLFREMTNWLAAVARTGDDTSPSKKVDVAWHEFILFTRDYAQFCADYFGRFIHHVPTPRLSGASPTNERASCSSNTGGGGNDCTPSSNCSSGQTGGTGSDCKAEQEAEFATALSGI